MTSQYPPPHLLALCGVLAPAVYIAAMLIAGAEYPGYSQSRQLISELGVAGAPSAALMNYGGFFLFGLLMTAFALGVHRGIQLGPGDWLGAALLLVQGVAHVALAFAPCDPGCRGSPGSLYHRAHFFLGDLIVFAATAAPLTLFGRLRRDPRWARWAWLIAAAGATAWVLHELPLPRVPVGIEQRLWLLVTFLWIETLAIRLLLNRRRPSSIRE